MIKKVLLSLLALVGLALVLTPMLIGRFVETKLGDAFEGGKVPDGIHLLAFERGWFSSQLSIGLDVTHPSMVRVLDLTSDFQGGTVIEVRQTLRHGPVVGPAAGWFAVLASQGTLTHPMSGLQLDSLAEVAFDQSVSIRLSDDQTRLRLDQRSVLSLEGWQLEVMASQGHPPEIELRVRELAWRQGATTAQLTELHAHAEQLVLEGGLPTGVGQIRAESLSWPGLEAKQIKVSAELAARNGISSGQATASVDDISSALIGTASDGMAVIEFSDINHRVVGPLLSSSGKPAQAAAHRQYWRTLLAENPRLNELSLALNSASGLASVVMVADGRPADGWMDGLVLQLDAQIPPPLLEQLAVLKALSELEPERSDEAVDEADKWLRGLRANGIVVLEGTDYVTRLSYSNQTAELNGMVMQLPSDW